MMDELDRQQEQQETVQTDQAAESADFEEDLHLEMALASVTGNTAELNKLYRKLAMQTHPDQHNGQGNGDMVKLNQTVNKWRKEAELAAKVWSITAILDDSGSMKGQKQRDAITAFNNFVAGQQEVKLGQANLTVCPLHNSFNYTLSNIVDKPIGELEKVPQKQFQCGGRTPLFDTIGFTIRRLEDQQLDPHCVVILIITDGEENDSRTWTVPTLRPVIEEKLELGWQFIYVTVDGRSRNTAERIGIPAKCIMTFQNFKEVFKVVGNSLTQLRLGEIKQITFEVEGK